MNRMTTRISNWALTGCLLLGLGLTGCREEMIDRGEYLEPGYGMLKMSVGSQGAVTRALGDLLPSDVTFDEEKEIESIAFFVKTDATEKDGKTVPGTFARFYSHTDNPELRLSEPLTGTGTPGFYTCGIRVYSQSWKNPQVITIANYMENGLKDKLEAVERWQDLQDICSPANVKPQTPLLMYGKVDELSYWANNQGGLATKEIVIQRIVSRIDIVNEAFDNTDPAKKGFVLKSATLLRPKAQSFLLPPGKAMLNSLGAATAGYETLTLTGDALTDEAKQKLDSIYVYENLNLDPTAWDTQATALKITGTWKGNPVEKIVTMIDKDDKVIALKRNHRYLVKLVKGPDETELKFQVSVADWAEGDSVNIVPKYKAPTFEWVSSTPATWDGTTNTFTIPAANADSPGTLSFKVKSENQSFAVVDTIAIFKATGDSVVNNSDILKNALSPDGSGITMNGTKFERTYSVNPPVKMYLGADKEPLHSIRLVFANSVYPTAADTLTIKY